MRAKHPEHVTLERGLAPSLLAAMPTTSTNKPVPSRRRLSPMKLTLARCGDPLQKLRKGAATDSRPGAKFGLVAFLGTAHGLGV